VPRTRRAAPAEEVPFADFVNIAKAFGDFRPAREVLKEVQAFRTVFVQLDHATKVQGFPLDRFTLTHGPSNEGKTLYVLGLVLSVLMAGGAVLYLDAERTTPMDWIVKLMSRYADHPLFKSERPDSYEQAILLVRRFLNVAANLKAKGRLPLLTPVLVVIDSLRKLVPKGLLDEILEDEAETAKAINAGKKVSSGRDRAAQIKAKMNAAWMDELVPLLEYAGASSVAIAREMLDPNNTNKFAMAAKNNYTVGGGSAVYYDSSLVTRIQRHGWVQKVTKKAEGEDGRDEVEVYGERHLITIKKTKVGGKDGKVTRAEFHSSNGSLVPFGFDRARDVYCLAQQFELFGKTRSGWFAWGKEKWNGEHQAVVKLTADAGMLAELEAEVRAQFAKRGPVEHDDETGEVE
jgi:hypothetical protein